jgi:ubiquinone biosynthesis protein Coq4
VTGTFGCANASSGFPSGRSAAHRENRGGRDGMSRAQGGTQEGRTMDIAVFTPDELPIALRALYTVAIANGSITPAEQQLFEALCEIHAQPVPKIGPITMKELAERITRPHARHRLVQLAFVTALVDTDPTEGQYAAVRAIADALGEEEKSLTLLRDLVNDSRAMVRFDVMRRMIGGTFMGQDAMDKAKTMASLFGHMTKLAKPNDEQAWRFKQLGLLPEGTLGREYWKFATRRKFHLPGEAGTMVERMVCHDFGHVLSGYDTTVEGELRQGSFQAGNRRDDGFVFLCFVLTQFHVGFTIQPIAEARVGAFQAPAVLEAVNRGAACKVDITDHWDFWKVVDRPVRELREEYGIAPIKYGGVGVAPEYVA